MDAKITKKRLSAMLSYDWLKIVGTAAAVIVVWLLIFQMTATRIMPSQQFVVVNYSSNLMLDDEFNNHFYDSKDILSHDIIEMEALDMVTNPAANEVFQARVELGDFDAMFISQQGDENTLVKNDDENAPKEYGRTYLETFLCAYRFRAYDLDLAAENNYFAQLESYLAPYYNDQGDLNAQKVGEDFRARVKRMKDKRYKTEEKIQEGIATDIDRIQKYKTSLDLFYEYLEKGYISLQATTHTPDESYNYEWTATCAINICPSTTTEEAKAAIAKLVRYQTEDEKVSAENMCVVLFNGEEKEAAYRFEGLVYVMNLVEGAVNNK